MKTDLKIENPTRSFIKAITDSTEHAQVSLQQHFYMTQCSVAQICLAVVAGALVTHVWLKRSFRIAF